MQFIPVVMDDVCINTIPHLVVGQNSPSLGMIRISTSEVRAEKEDLIYLSNFLQCAAISHFVRGFRFMHLLPADLFLASVMQRFALAA